MNQQRNKFPNAKRAGLMALIVLGVLGFVLYFVPRSNCDDLDDPQVKHLTERAGQGDMTAISALYDYNKFNAIKPLEEYWALEGALRGDVRLRREYVKLFKTRFNVEEKKQIIEVVKGQKGMVGAACLIFYLTHEGNQATACPQ